MVLRRQRFGHHHQTAGVFIEPVHNAGARNLRQRGVVCQKAVEQRAAPIACRRVHHHAGGLIEHHHAVVFVDNVQIHRLGRKCQHFFALRHRHFDALRAHQLIFRLRGAAVYLNRALFNPAGEAAARIIGQHFGQSRIQPQTGQIHRHS